MPGSQPAFDDRINALPLPDLYARLRDTGLVVKLLELARLEDLGPESIDLTSESTPTPAQTAALTIRARSSGVLSGLAVLPDLLQTFNVDATIEPHLADGAHFKADDPIATLTGPRADLTRVERTMLNLLGRLSGVATTTAEYVRTIGDGPVPAGPPAKLYDTRKTTPGLRVLEKFAVRCGGGHCHRLGLHDAVLIKDNHIAGQSPDEIARSVRKAASAAHNQGLPNDPFGPRPRFIMVEVDTLDQFRSILTIEPGTVDLVLLDNMPPPVLREAVGMRTDADSKIQLEASGGVNLQTIAEIARTGVDRISVGALTRDAGSIDFGLDAD